MIYRSGDGTIKRNSHKSCFPDCSQNMTQSGYRKGGGESSFLRLFPTRTHFGLQGLPMELPGNSQGQFVKILTRFRHRFCLFFDDFGESCLQQMQSSIFVSTVLGAIFVGWGQARGRGWAQPSLSLSLSLYICMYPTRRCSSGICFLEPQLIELLIIG